MASEKKKEKCSGNQKRHFFGCDILEAIPAIICLEDENVDEIRWLAVVPANPGAGAIPTDTSATSGDATVTGARLDEGRDGSLIGRTEVQC